MNSVIEYPKKFAEKYKSENRVFVINLCSEHVVELQLVHPSINSRNTEANKFGFSIYLPFDHTTSEGVQELESFKSRSYFTEFEKSDDSEMESYYCNCKEDYGKLENLVKSILSDLKGFKISDEIYITHFFS